MDIARAWLVHQVNSCPAWRSHVGTNTTHQFQPTFKSTQRNAQGTTEAPRERLYQHHGARNRDTYSGICGYWEGSLKAYALQQEGIKKAVVVDRRSGSSAKICPRTLVDIQARRTEDAHLTSKAKTHTKHELARP